MSLNEMRIKIARRIRQSISESGVSVDAIPAEQLDALISAIADGVLLTVDDAMEEAGLTAMRGTSAGDSMAEQSTERVLWEGRPFLSLTTFYQITTERVRLIHGIIGKDRDDIELIRIQDLDLTQGITERILGIGDVTIKSSDQSKPDTTLRNVRDVEKVHETLRRAMLDARRRYRYSVQEEM